MQTIVISNQKGGVGKSTTSYHLLRAAILAGKRVLAVDSDPQGNLTSVLTRDIESDQVGLADVLSSATDVKVRDVIVPGLWPGLDIVPTPSGRNLGMVRDQLVVSGLGRERRLRDALAVVDDDYDICLIDCPPSLDQLTVNALTAADTVGVITEARLWSTDGLAQLLETIRDVREYYNPAVTIAGVLVNKYERGTISAAHWLNELAENAQALGLEVLDPPIPKRVVIADCVEASDTLETWGQIGRDAMDTYTQHLNTLTHDQGARS